MADMTGEAPVPDMVACCDRQWDRNIYAQCAVCTSDLWDPKPPPPPAPGPAAGTTVMDGHPPPAAGVDVLVCGHRLTVIDGQTLRLGRQDDFETADVFREAANISRVHATLRFADGRLRVTDTGSSNGTFVDGQRLPPDFEYVLKEGQTLRLASNIAVEILWERQ